MPKRSAHTVYRAEHFGAPAVSLGMRMPWCFAVLFLAAAVRAAPVAPADFYVSTGGNDAWSGKLAAAAADGKDGPLASPNGARQAVRKLRETAKDRQTPVVVLFRGGTYVLNAPWELWAEDGGSEKSPVVYASYPGETPIVSAGVRITGWKVDPRGRWTVNLPEVKAGHWNFSQLFVDGQRRYRPRWPKDGYSLIAGHARGVQGQNRGDDAFRFARGDIAATWKNLADVEVLAFHIWSMSMLRIAEVDADKNIVHFTGPTADPSEWAQLRPDMRYIVENVGEALDRPGQWYLDRPTGELTYLPMPGEDPEKSVVIAPRVDRVLTITGVVEGHGQPAHPRVEHLEFRGLTFSHSNWTVPAAGSSIPQAAVSMPAAATVVGARDVRFIGCNFTQLGTYGLELGAACRDGRVEGCRFVDLGGGGIKLGTTGRAADPALAAGGHVIRDNLIAHAGRINPAGVGVWIGQADHNTVEHNDIYDLYYTAVSVGWTWGYDPSDAHHNVIADNHMHTLGQGVLSDMGGIYTLGISPGTVLRGNRMHDIERFTYGGWGIYYDEGTTGIVAENNLVYRTHDGSFHQHYGQDNSVINNIFGPSQTVQFGPTRIDWPGHDGTVRPGKAFTFRNNIVDGWGAPSAIRAEWGSALMAAHMDKFDVDHNVYWNGGKPVMFNGMSWEQWHDKGMDRGSVVADPKLADIAKDDYQLAADSPAMALGFKPFDISGAGRLQREPPDMDPARWPRAFPPPPDARRAIIDSFEETPVGDRTDHATTLEENAQAVIRVSDEQALTGRQSLKFIDKAGQRFNYSPHIFWRPEFHSDRDPWGIRCHFAVRREEGTPWVHDWRTSGNPYRTGPSLQIAADGALTVGGATMRPPMNVPAGKWVAFDIQFKHGAKVSTYDLVVTVAGAEPRKFTDLPCETGFDSLDWFGFVASGDRDGVFYLDDLRLELQ